MKKILPWLRVEWANERAKLLKSSSVWLAGGFAFIFGIGYDIIDVWHILPDDMKGYLPNGWPRAISSIAFLLVLGGRITRFKLGKSDDSSRPNQ